MITIVVTAKPTGEGANRARGGDNRDFFLLVVADFYAIRGHCRYSFVCRCGSKGAWEVKAAYALIVRAIAAPPKISTCN